MVQNIDLPEAIVFYGQDVFVNDQQQLLPGISELLQDCRDVQTPVVVLDTTGDFKTEETMTTEVQVYDASSLPPPPNPRALYSAIQTLTVQPRGFGGSSGFGQARGTDPRRTPLFQRTVVLCNSIEACQAARFVGARCISKVDNDLADAVVNKWDEFTIDDIATPGSFLLNPPQPKDDYGNCVDIYELMDHYYEQQGEQGQPQSTTVKQQTQPPSMDDEDNMARILADLDSL
jgi:hypothetical protein